MKNKYTRILKYLVVIVIFSLTVGYSAFNNKLLINNIVANVRIKADIRVTGILFTEATADAMPQYENYNVDSLLMDINLPDENSTITYKVKITNFGNQEMGIFSINNLNENLDYEIKDYKLRSKICNKETCTLGTTKEFFITIKYKENRFEKSNTNYNIRLNVDFRKINTITYKGITNNGYPTYIMDGDDLNINLVNQIPKKIIAYTNNVKTDKNLYKYENNNFTYNNVEGNVILEYIDKVYLTSLREGLYFKEDQYLTKIKSISFVENENIPATALKVYDVSYDKNNLVKAWIDTEYNLYIGSEWKIYSKDLSYAFYNMSGVESIIFDNLNTSETTSMNSLFFGLSKITNLNLSMFDTSNVINMGFMFQNCNHLAELDLSSFNTTKVTNMRNMFYNMKNLNNLNIKSFNTENVKNMNYMFQDCSKLNELDLSNFNTINVTEMYAMFYNCISLVSINLSSFDTSNVITFQEMFMNCTALKEINVSSFNTKKVQSMKNLFNNCISLTNLNLSNFDTSNVTDMQTMFNNLKNVKVLDLSNFNTSKVKNMYEIFKDCESLEILNISNFDMSLITTTSSMFSNCYLLKELDVSNFNTKNVTNMNGMFYNCSSLIKLDVSNFNTSQVTNMKNMFYNCILLKELDLSKFDTSRVTTMQGMFYNMNNIEVLDLSGFDTSQVTNMDGMFSACTNIKELNLRNFDTSKVTTMYGMFKKCTSIEELDLSSFDTSKVTSTAWMFEDMLLRKIYVSDKWNLDNVIDSDGMFDSVYNLVGGKGTVYTYSYTDKTYGRVDEGIENPGYLTYKNYEL